MYWVLSYYYNICIIILIVINEVISSFKAHVVKLLKKTTTKID